MYLINSIRAEINIGKLVEATGRRCDIISIGAITKSIHDRLLSLSGHCANRSRVKTESRPSRVYVSGTHNPAQYVLYDITNVSPAAFVCNDANAGLRNMPAESPAAIVNVFRVKPRRCTSGWERLLHEWPVHKSLFLQVEMAKPFSGSFGTEGNIIRRASFKGNMYNLNFSQYLFIKIFHERACTSF